jgi:hypothetical protein
MDWLTPFAIGQILFNVGIALMLFVIVKKIISEKILRAKASTLSMVQSMHPKLFEKEILHGRFFPYGMLVISRSNEKEPLQKGIVVGYAQHHSSPPMPMVRFINPVTGILDTEPFICFTILIPHSDFMWEFLSSMNYDQQYEYLSKIVNGSLSLPVEDNRI